MYNPIFMHIGVGLYLYPYIYAYRGLPDPFIHADWGQRVGFGTARPPRCAARRDSLTQRAPRRRSNKSPAPSLVIHPCGNLCEYRLGVRVQRLESIFGENRLLKGPRKKYTAVNAGYRKLPVRCGLRAAPRGETR